MEFPYYMSFSSLLKPLVSEEKDKYLALASLAEIGKFIPEIDTSKDIDLLPVAFNACVINRVNKNDDIIDTATAVSIYKHFINKPINIEHNRQKVIGVILTAGFSEYGTDKPLTEEEVKNLTGPFNITLGGVIWKSINPRVAQIIEESNDPDSVYYEAISASWELGFYEYKILLLNQKDKDFEKGQIISDASEFEKVKPYLKALKGGGMYDGKRVCRVPFASEGSVVVPMGVGITENPAAEVKGILTKDGEELVKTQEEACASSIEEHLEILKGLNLKSGEHYIVNCSCGSVISQCRCTSSNKKIETIQDGCENCKENKNKFSHSSNSHVNIERNIMKITSLKDITDESLQQMKASAIADFVQTELSEKAKVWESEKTQYENKVKEAVASQAETSKELNSVKDELKALKEALAALEKEKEERQKVEKFNERMTKVNEAYDLTDEARAAIADELKAIASDEDFEKWNKKASILLKGFAKKVETPEEKVAREEAAKKQTKEEAKAAFQKAYASASTKEDKDKILNEALENAIIDKSEIPNTSSASEPSLREKYLTAFAKENFVIRM